MSEGSEVTSEYRGFILQLLLLKGYDSTMRVPQCFYATHSADVRTASFRTFTRMMYLPRVYLVARIAFPSNYGPYYRGFETTQFLNGTVNGTVYRYHGYFWFGSGFMPVFVKFYGIMFVVLRIWGMKCAAERPSRPLKCSQVLKQNRQSVHPMVMVSSSRCCIMGRLPRF